MLRHQGLYFLYAEPISSNIPTFILPCLLISNLSLHPHFLFNLPLSFLLFITQIKFPRDREVFYLIYVMALSVAMIR